MTAGGNKRWNRRGILSVVVGWGASSVAAIAIGLKRLVRAEPCRRPTPPQKSNGIVRHRTALASNAVTIPARIGRESGEVNARFVFAIVIGWFAFVFVGLAFLMRTFESTQPYPKPPPDATYPSPRLILYPFALEPRYLAAQQRTLAGGPMPISRAMVEIAARPDPYAPIGTESAHEP